MYGALEGRLTSSAKVARQMAGLQTSGDTTKITTARRIVSQQQGMVGSLQHADAALAAILGRGVKYGVARRPQRSLASSAQFSRTVRLGEALTRRAELIGCFRCWRRLPIRTRRSRSSTYCPIRTRQGLDRSPYCRTSRSFLLRRSRQSSEQSLNGAMWRTHRHLTEVDRSKSRLALQPVARSKAVRQPGRYLSLRPLAVSRP